MKAKISGIIIFLPVLLLLSGCATTPHIIGYDVIKSSEPVPKLGKVFILPINDERPQQERRGVKGKLLSFSSKDSHFSKRVSEAIRDILAEELNSAGFYTVEEQALSDYQISGSVRHFQAIMSPAKITFLPYLGSLSTLWVKDEFTIAMSVYIKMTDRRQKILIDKTFDVSEDMKLPTGLLNLARYSRGFNYKLKLLDEALKDVMRQIREEAVKQVKR
jgi:altronate dehydratase